MPLFGTRGAASLTGFGGLAKLGYLLRNSLRFRRANSAFLNRTFGTPTSNILWTWSCWFKRGQLGSGQRFFGRGTDASGINQTAFTLNSDDTINFFIGDGAGSTLAYLATSQVFRDPASWYHIVFVYDSANGTANNRMRMYLNGTEITAFSSRTNPSSSQSSQWNVNSVEHRIGVLPTSPSSYFDGYMAEVNFIDGQALTPSSFGKTDNATNTWVPIKYAGTYGNNGFYLPFTNTTSTSTLGNDFSGNGNNWTVNNISLTAGVTYDSMTDVPTLTSETAANYAVMSPIDVSPLGATISNGNLRFNNGNGGAQATVRATIGISSGKYYWETTCTTFGGSNPDTGILGSNSSLASDDQYVGNYALGYSYAGSGQKRNNNSGTSYGASYTSGDVIGVALDMDAGTLTFYKNNASQGTAFTGLSGLFSPAISGYNGIIWDVNFGQRPFAYTPPSGFKALNTFNLP